MVELADSMRRFKWLGVYERILERRTKNAFLPEGFVTWQSVSVFQVVVHLISMQLRVFPVSLCGLCSHNLY